MSWSDTQAAIQGAIAAASGMVTIWKFQNADAPPLPYVAIGLGPLIEVGQDAVMASLRGGTPPSGQEIALSVRGLRESVLLVEVFTEASAGSSWAMSTAETIRARLRLPAAREALAAVGVTPFDATAAQFAPDIVALGFRGRAVLTVRCYLPAPTVEEYTTYIGTVAGTFTTNGDHEETFTASIPS